MYEFQSLSSNTGAVCRLNCTRSCGWCVAASQFGFNLRFTSDDVLGMFLWAYLNRDYNSFSVDKVPSGGVHSLGPVSAPGAVKVVLCV